MLQFAKPYFTPSDIEKGTKWNDEISKQLANSNIGLICLTRENITRPWILFEAGALSKDLERSRVCSVLFGISDSELTGPLTTFQATKFDRADFKKMMQTVNETGGSHMLDVNTFNRVFEKWWPDLEEKIQAILSAQRTVDTTTKRSDRDLLEELISLTRALSRSSNRERDGGNLPTGLIRDLVNSSAKLIEIKSKLLNNDVNIQIHSLLRIAKYLARRAETNEDDAVERITQLARECEDFIPF